MGELKSHAEDLIFRIVSETLADCYAFLEEIAPALVRKNDLQRDLDYIQKRWLHEGLQFFTTSLPKLGDWFDEIALRGNKVERVVGFDPYDGLYPCFLRPIWQAIARQDELLLNEDAAQLFRIVRTLLHGLKKLEIPFSDEQKQDKLDAFLRIEEELEMFELPVDTVMVRAQLLMEEWSQGYHPECPDPTHGPGAVAGGEKHSQKWVFDTRYESVHKEWPYWEYLFPVRSVGATGESQSRDIWSCNIPRAQPVQLAACAASFRAMRREAEPTARMLFVPKDSRGPRIISCEPKELMYIQQGVSRHLVKYITRHRYTKGHVNFDDQTVNGKLALEGSKSLEWATLDLSDASDRVSCELVNYLFPKRVTTKWFALRSTATVVNNSQRIRLRKFAPMGSALCFPVESLVFWAIAVATIWKIVGDRDLATQLVYVYGDDIIVANDYAKEVMLQLELAGLKVNQEKSAYGDHFFRESCGVDAWKGYDVTPQRMKKLPPQRPSDGGGIIAWLQYAENAQYVMPRRSSAMLRVVEDLTGPIPRVPFSQPFLSIVTKAGHWSHQDYRDLQWDPAKGYYRSKLLCSKTKKLTDAPTTWSRLQRDLIEDFADRDPSVVVDRQSTLIRRKRTNVTYLPWVSNN